MSNNTLTLAREILAQNERLLALLEADAPAAEVKVERKARKTRKASKKAAPKATPKAEAVDTRFLTQDTRKAFIADHEWAVEHTSTRALVEAVVVGGQPLSDGWDVGPKYRAMFADTPKAETKKARKTRKVAAKVEPDAPAKELSPEHASQGPRDALGRITPKAQWAMREALAETGKFDRYEIDEIVASQA